MNAKIGAMVISALMLMAATPAVSAGPYEDARIRYLTVKAELLELIAIWQTARADFFQALAEWRANPTEANLANLVQVTKDSAVEMSNVMIKYLQLLRIGVESTRGLSDEEKTQFYAEIDGYISELQAKQAAVQGAENAQEVRDTARELWDYWIQIRVRVKYITGRLFTATAEAALWRAQAFAGWVEARIEELKENGIDTSALESWLADFNSNLELAEQRIENAKVKVEEITDNVTFLQMFAAADAHIRAAVSYLREALKDLRDIIVEMRSKGYTVTLSGSGTLVARGTGSAYISGTGAVHVRAPIQGTMLVSPNAVVTTAGVGTKTVLENGWVQYQGYGGAVVAGTDIVVDISGEGISILACGIGTATLTGTGWYRTYGVSYYGADDWTATGFTVTLETGEVQE